MFPGAFKIRDLEPAFYSTGDDWIRYSITSWIIWTDKPVSEIYARIRPFLDPGDQILIVKLDMQDSFGTLSPWIWNWINSKAPSIIDTGPAAQNIVQSVFGRLPPPTKKT
jgi:hypothetical protein